MYSTTPRPLPQSNSKQQQQWRVIKIANEGLAFLRRECDRVKSYYKKLANMTGEDIEKEKQYSEERQMR